MPPKPKPKKTTNEITEIELDKLKKHALQHKGGMKSKHMKNMVKFMKDGMTFSKAHMESLKLDKDKKVVKPKKEKTLKYGYSEK